MEPEVDLERARREAKALLRAARAGERAALERLRPDRAPCLADAQRAVARALGEGSWPALVRRAERALAAEAAELLAAVRAGECHRARALAEARPRAAKALRRTGGPVLLEAAREGRADVVGTLLELGVPANARERASGETALHAAARLGRLDVVDRLVGWVPVDRQARDGVGRTALDACVEGARTAPAGAAHLAVARVLVATGVHARADAAARAPGALGAWLRERLADPPERPRNAGELGELAWAADAELLAHLATSPLAETREAGDGIALRTGRFDNTRNGVVCSRLPAERADEEIAALLAWLDGAPAQWLVGAEVDPRDLGERLERAGCRPERSAVFMAAPLGAGTGGPAAGSTPASPAGFAAAPVDAREAAGARAAPRGIEIAPLRAPGELAEALRAAGALDDDPAEAELEIALLASLALAAGRPLQHLVARRAGRPIGVASTFAASGALLLTDLAVAPPARRAGVGSALVRHALRAGAAAGLPRALLAPTPATVPFYEALGFALLPSPPDRAYYAPVR